MVRKSLFIYLAAALLILLFVANAALAAPHICAVCKKPITGKMFVQAGGKYFHPEHFKCTNCGKRIKTSRYFERDGHIYDSTCYVELFAPRCAYCGKPIPGHYVEVEGRKYHESCYDYRVALRCDLCGDIIEGPYLVDFFGDKVHKSHKGKAAQCEYCGRFISPTISKGSTIYADGREVCGFCSASIISSYQGAVDLMNMVRDTLEKEGIKVNLNRLVLSPVDKVRMLTLKPPRGSQAQAFTFYQNSTRLYGLLSRKDFRIYILDRLPKIEFITTIAHELMHVWLGQNAEFLMDPMLTEGSCNFAAFLALRHFVPEARYAIDKLAKDDDPIYGDGYRHVVLFAEKVGTKKWLDYLKNNTMPPW